MNTVPSPPLILQAALDAHRANRLGEAFAGYERHLAGDPEDPLALYGVAAIKLGEGDIAYYPHACRALFGARPSNLDAAQASDSIVRLLLRHCYQDHARQFLDLCEQNGIALPADAELREAVTLPPYLAPSRYDKALGKELERYRPIESAHYVYAIDVVGGCNLRCPTCPVSQNASLPKGLMRLDLFEKILGKIEAESIDSRPDLWLFNWTEPLLHPEIDTFVEASAARGFTTLISTNLNLGTRLEALMKAKPTRLKISLSSLQQSKYGRTHARGSIDQVVANLHALAGYRDHYKSPTEIWIGHHLYRDTLEEQPAIAALAAKLGFGYAPSPAIVAPIERVMAMQRQPANDDVGGLRNNFLFDPVAIPARMAQKRSGTKDCELRFNMTAIQHEGLVNLCCATTQALGKATAFLDHAHAEIEAMKYDNAFCKKCMAGNLHLTMADR